MPLRNDTGELIWGIGRELRFILNLSSVKLVIFIIPIHYLIEFRAVNTMLQHKIRWRLKTRVGVNQGVRGKPNTRIGTEMWKGLIFLGAEWPHCWIRAGSRIPAGWKGKGGPGASGELHTGLCTLAYKLMVSKTISLETLLPGMFKHHLLGEPCLQTVWVALPWVTSSPSALPPLLLLC